MVEDKEIKPETCRMAGLRLPCGFLKLFGEAAWPQGNFMREISAKELVKEMKIGWNLGNTLDSVNDRIDSSSAPEAWETAWGNPVTSKELIEKIIDEGFNVIRFPVSWRNHLGEAPEYHINEAWMNRVQELVDYACNKGAFVILNIHHEGWHDPYYSNRDAAAAKLIKVWQQIAKRFESYDEHLIFEGMNEPRKCGTALEWNGGDQEGWDVVNYLNKVFVDTIRQSGGNNPKRCLMLPGYAANCREGIRNLEIPAGDDKLMASVHSYDPFDFALNPRGRGLWNRETEVIDRIAQDIKELFIDKGIPAVVGEFGAGYKPVVGNEASRAEWTEYFLEKLRGIGVPCVWWDNGHFAGGGEPLGIIDRKTLEWKYPLVVDALKKGMK